MDTLFARAGFLVLMFCALAPARADQFADTVDVFRNAIESKGFFDSAYGYAVFPTIGKGGIGIGDFFVLSRKTRVIRQKQH